MKRFLISLIVALGTAAVLLYQGGAFAEKPAETKAQAAPSETKTEESQANGITAQIDKTSLNNGGTITITGSVPAGKPVFQAVFCIDEREESFRRHLEELVPEAETFGAAGFFNVAMYYQGVADAHFVPLCPVVIRPQHWVVEKPPYTFEETHRNRAQTRRALGAAQRRACATLLRRARREDRRPGHDRRAGRPRVRPHEATSPVADGRGDGAGGGRRPSLCSGSVPHQALRGPRMTSRR